MASQNAISIATPRFISSRRNSSIGLRPSKKAFSVFATKFGIPSFKSVGKSCRECGGQGAIECPGCKGTGKNKKNGNIFERWKCYDCQGFGLKSCPVCGKGGLTPEQRGER